MTPSDDPINYQMTRLPNDEMLKLIVKLALAALIANAAWRLGSAYLQFYRFTDAVTQAAQFGSEKFAGEIERARPRAGEQNTTSRSPKTRSPCAATIEATPSSTART